MSSFPDISDPSDFSDTSIPTLSEFDTILRCQVCKEMFDTPMITSCSHTFCSQCIRQCLSADGKCPTCRAQDQSSKLRKNGVVQNLVSVWLKIRPNVLETIQKADEKIAIENHGKRKLEVDSMADSRHTKRQTRSSSRRVTSSANPAEIVVLDSEDEQDGEFLLEAEKPSPSDGLVACPICRVRMKEEMVFLHLDRCQTPAPQQGSTFLINQSKPNPQYTHLPFLSYSILKESDLRKKLQQLGIPAMGSKQIMEKRHTHWLNLWNANCDSDNPRAKRDLLKDLEAWEKSQMSNQSSAVMRKDFDGDRWSKGHNDQFKQLIAQARSRGQAKLNGAVDKGIVKSNQKDSVLNDTSKLTDGLDDQETTAKQMFKLAVTQATEDSTTDDDSLYRARTPPQPSSSLGLGSSLSQSATPSGNKAPLFQAHEEPVEPDDVDMTAK